MYTTTTRSAGEVKSDQTTPNNIEYQQQQTNRIDTTHTLVCVCASHLLAPVSADTGGRAVTTADASTMSSTTIGITFGSWWWEWCERDGPAANDTGAPGAGAAVDVVATGLTPMCTPWTHGCFGCCAPCVTVVGEMFVGCVVVVVVVVVVAVGVAGSAVVVVVGTLRC